MYKLTEFTKIVGHLGDGRYRQIRLKDIQTIVPTTNGVCFGVGAGEYYTADISLEKFMIKYAVLKLFCRVHRSTVVNWKRVKYFNLSTLSLEMDNGDKRKCSRDGMNSYKKISGIEVVDPQYKLDYDGEAELPSPAPLRSIKRKPKLK